MPTQNDIEQQQQRLAIHRRTLAHLLDQQAQFSAGHVPAHINNGIVEARTHIAQIKATLRSWGDEVQSLPDDEEKSPSIAREVNLPRSILFSPTEDIRIPPFEYLKLSLPEPIEDLSVLNNDLSGFVLEESDTKPKNDTVLFDWSKLSRDVSSLPSGSEYLNPPVLTVTSGFQNDTLQAEPRKPTWLEIRWSQLVDLSPQQRFRWKQWLVATILGWVTLGCGIRRLRILIMHEWGLRCERRIWLRISFLIAVAGIAGLMGAFVSLIGDLRVWVVVIALTSIVIGWLQWQTLRQSFFQWGRWGLWTCLGGLIGGVASGGIVLLGQWIGIHDFLARWIGLIVVGIVGGAISGRVLVSMRDD